MGVNGLLRLLQPISVPRQLSHFQGQTLGVDGYAWLHRAAASCAEDLVRNTDTTKLVQSIDKRIRLYESAGINLYFVFDGANIDMKARVSAQRRKAREQAKAAYLMKQSQNVMGGVSITPDHAAMVVAYLKARGIRFVVAPYEADSQLVWLEKNGHVDGILSEDGDLLVFGASKLLTKADGRTGGCVEVSADRLPAHFDAASIRALAIISGCDYSPGVAGLGPIKTSALVKEYAGNLMEICATLLRNGRIDEQFIQEAKRADLAFQFQRVWDPKACNIVHLNDPLNGDVDIDLLQDTIIGPLLPRPDAHRIARCVVDPNNPKRALPVSPAVAHFVSRLPPIALATPSKYSSPAAVRSMVERRLPMTPTNSVQVSPFFRQKSAISVAHDTSNADKENTYILPTPPVSITSTSRLESTTVTPTSLKRNRSDYSDALGHMKALRTDTVVDMPNPSPTTCTRSSENPFDTSLSHKARSPASTTPKTNTANVVKQDPERVQTLLTPQNEAQTNNNFDTMGSNRLSTSFMSNPTHDTTTETEVPNVMEKLASLQKFAYTKG